MMKFTAIACFLLGASIVAGTASAYTINDRITDPDFKTASLAGWSRNSVDHSADINYWKDVIGDPTIFEVFGVNITRNGSNITFDLFTNLEKKSDGITVGSYKFYLADFAIDANRDGTFEYGVVLQDHDDWKNLQASAGTHDEGLYVNPTWKISKDFYEEAPSLSGGMWYGEKYSDGHGFPLLDPKVAVDTYDQFHALTVASLLGQSGDEYKYKYSFTMALSALGLSDTSPDPGIFWGGATCANDAINSAPVPEPGTMLLLGTGLVGIIGAKRRSRKSA